uniref:Uncharacterized protein n=1 Tax=Arundo donax TaxID=35708 RepID=A0A0A9AEN7_ARUDO
MDLLLLLSHEVVGGMPLVVPSGFLPDGCFSSPCFFFVVLDLVQRRRGVRSCFTMAELFHGCLDFPVRVDRAQLLIPIFNGGILDWSSPVMPPPNLRLRPPLLQVLCPWRLPGGPPACQTARTEKPFFHLCHGGSTAHSRSHRVVPSRMDASMEVAWLMVPWMTLVSCSDDSWRRR